MLKSQIKSHTLTVEDVNTQLSQLDRSARQKLTREVMEVTGVMTQMDLTDIYRTFHPNKEEHTFFSAPYGTFSKIDHILSNIANLNIYQKLE